MENYSIIIFILAIMIGLEYPYILKDINKAQILPYIGYAALITIAAMGLRMARVFLQKVNLQKAFQKKKARVPEAALLDLSSSLIISWSGMRGIVSLAIAIGLPVTIEENQPFPMRSEIIFIATVVVLFTIVGQGLTLPWIVKKLHPKPVDGKTAVLKSP